MIHGRWRDSGLLCCYFFCFNNGITSNVSLLPLYVIFCLYVVLQSNTIDKTPLLFSPILLFLTVSPLYPGEIFSTGLFRRDSTTVNSSLHVLHFLVHLTTSDFLLVNVSGNPSLFEPYNTFVVSGTSTSDTYPPFPSRIVHGLEHPDLFFQAQIRYISSFGHLPNLVHRPLYKTKYKI